MALMRALVVAVSLLLLVGCGSSAEPRTSTSGADQPDGLVVTKPDGTRVRMAPIRVKCARSEYDPAVKVVQLTTRKPGGGLFVEIVPEDVQGGQTFDLPIDSGDAESGPANAFIFVGMMPDLETSTAEEEATGTLEVVGASCEPLSVELSVDAILGSEYFEGGRLRVNGHFEYSE